MPGVSVPGGWYHRDYHNLRRRDNTLQTFARLHAVHAVQPDRRLADHLLQRQRGEARTRHQLRRHQRAGDDRKMWYNGFEYNFNARLPHGITLFGGGMSERMLAQVCDDSWNPNLLLYCDQTKSGMPFRTQFKIAGIVPIKYGIQVGVSFQSLPGLRLRHRRAVGREGGPTGPDRPAVGDAAEHARTAPARCG